MTARTIVRRTLVVAILIYTWYAWSAVAQQSPWWPAHALAAAILLLLVWRALIVAEGRR